MSVPAGTGVWLRNTAAPRREISCRNYEFLLETARVFTGGGSA